MGIFLILTNFCFFCEGKKTRTNLFFLFLICFSFLFLKEYIYFLSFSLAI
nr:MAG TPA: hypothetical protein [Caudoviricetes sp.]